MDLRRYLFEKRMSVKDFAESIGYQRNYISGIMHMKIKPGKGVAKIIENATNGEVTFEELMYKELIPRNSHKALLQKALR